ncbi:putative T6SS immunity periplasmic lipoprotein [Pantoea osteomyelitidis]|uniref:T6SS immunity periplasmic lipoprotein n=1 Tax=Pantoea osteomyelitidis TaxID=3230026 RepID=A0ABW7PUG5_9GAMM
MKPLKFNTVFSLLSVLLVAGCPYGDRLTPPENASVSATPNGVCFQVKDAKDYQLVIISIAPKGAAEEQRWYKDKPDLDSKNGELCIPSAFYPFTEHKEFVVDYVLAPKQRKPNQLNTRRIIIGFQIISGNAYRIPLKPFEQ